MAEKLITTERLDPRLDKASQLLVPKSKSAASLKEALLCSIAFAAAGLMLAAAIILGPGWEHMTDVMPVNQDSVAAQPAETPKAMVVQVPADGFELSAAPLPADGINEAVLLSEDELSAGNRAK